MVAGDTEMPLAAVDPGPARPEGECRCGAGVCTPAWGGVHAPRGVTVCAHGWARHGRVSVHLWGVHVGSGRPFVVRI